MRLLLSAATDWRTLVWLLLGVAAAAALSNPFPVVIGLGLYVWAVQRLVSSPRFQEAAERVRVAKAMAARWQQVEQSAASLLPALARSKSWVIQAVEAITQIKLTPTRTWHERAKDVVGDARQIYQEWLAHPKEQAARTPMVEQGLQMAYLYLRILRAFYAIHNDPRPDLRDVRERLERNRQRLQQLRDMEARRDLTTAIEMDERVLRQAESEAVEMERYLAKMAAIESSLEALRRQILDPEGEGAEERLKDLLVEAEAMDHALEEVRQRSRRRVRA